MKYYTDIFYCDNCGEDTKHSVCESEHERDMSNDIRTCLTCNWWWSGLTDKYSPPLNNETITANK